MSRNLHRRLRRVAGTSLRTKIESKTYRFRVWVEGSGLRVLPTPEEPKLGFGVQEFKNHRDPVLMILKDLLQLRIRLDAVVFTGVSCRVSRDLRSALEPQPTGRNG